MTSPGPTHSGSPFVGRSREIGILTHLLEEGLEGRLGLVRVAGSIGSGRRRLIAEALNRGPDVEWIHLAPGGVEPDLRRWMRTELIDLLDTYPDAPLPSWALHVMEAWAPALGARSAVPALSREHVPEDDAPKILGRAIGAVLLAITGRTSVIVDAGLWPKHGNLGLTLSALVASLQEPGAVVIAAVEDDDPFPDPHGQRTLLLEPLDGETVSQLTALWQTGKGGDALASWLMRVTSGHPFFLQEAVRWLEELGHVRVHEDERRVEVLSSIERWPIPMNLDAVLEMRYRRLPPAALRLMHLIAQADGQIELETLRSRWEDDDSFEEGMTWLRRRDFLRDRSARRPLALASPRWRAIARSNVIPLPSPKTGAVFGPTSEAPLARLSDRVDALGKSRSNLAPEDLRRETAEIARRLRGRRGPAWDGARGRLAVHAARMRLGESRPNRAFLWIRWGLARTSPDLHPGLRRALRALGAEVHEQRDNPKLAAVYRRDALEEAAASGHLLAATRLSVLVDEASRRFGTPSHHSLETELRDKGMDSAAALAAFTEVASLIDARNLDLARRAMDDYSIRRVAPWIERLDSDSMKRVPMSDSIAPGWTWGLGAGSAWFRTLERIEVALEDESSIGDAALADVQAAALTLGFLPLAADVAESRIWRRLRVTTAPRRAGRARDASETHFGQMLADAAAILKQLDSPHRVRDLSLRLRETEAGNHPLFPELFGAYLLKSMSAPLPASTSSLEIHFTGVPRIHHGGRQWPKALWPEWWTELWGSAVSADLLGADLDQREMEHRLRSAGHLPTDRFPELLGLANELFRGPERSAGGLATRSGNIVVEWTGIACDIRDAWLAFQRADVESDPARARALYAGGLDRIEGSYLPGLDSPEVGRVRSVLHGAVTRALLACLAGEPVPASRFNRWLGGPVRAVNGREIAARFIEKRGWTQAARALRHA